MEKCSENRASADYNCRGERPYILDSTVEKYQSGSVRSVLKAYPDGSRSLKVFKQPIRRFPRRQRREPRSIVISKADCSRYYVPEYVREFFEMLPEFEVEVAREDLALIKNVKSRDKRAVSMICDIARCNKWTHFVTFTLDPHKVDRESYRDALGKVTKWLNHLRNKYPEVCYLMVSEIHKKGGYHFHALIYLPDASILVDSGIKDRSSKKPIYNIPSFTWGFTTAIECDNSPKVWLYLSKYIVKGVGSSFSSLGRHRYYSSRNCVRPCRYVFAVPVEPMSDMVQVWNNDLSVGYESPPADLNEKGGTGNEE